MADNIILGVKKEEDPSENRVSIVPKDVKSIIDLGISVHVEKDSGIKAGYSNEEYESSGATLVTTLSEKTNIITAVNAFYNTKSKYVKNSSIITLSDIRTNEEVSRVCEENDLSLFAMEFVPRIARAQKLDALSSQASIAGYRAGLLAATSLKKYLPLMMTAAGTIPPSSILVLGAGVAGLQAIATAKRMGAIVFATDVRIASKEQVESLGGKFLTVEQSDDMETAGGYAKEVSDDYKKKQAAMMREALKKNDIVICTALIPGKPAPRILNEDLVKLMKAGSIVYDLAAEQGGNSAFSEPGKINVVEGIKIIGVKNLMNRLPLTASSLYSKNLFSFIRNLYSKEKKDFNINLEDEIISKTLIKEI